MSLEKPRALCPTCGLVKPVQKGEKYSFVREPIWWPVGRCPPCDSIAWSQEPKLFGIKVEGLGRFRTRGPS